MTTDHTLYIGRFAPSPSGALHFGSLLAAVASYLDARANNGRWLLRMEDLDPAREPPEAADDILRTLELFSLHWDGDVLYQSRRLPAYQEALDGLQDAGLIYRCECSRAQIRAMGGVYDGRCRQHSPAATTPAALRIRVPDCTVTFTDIIQGQYTQQLQHDCGDFVLRRKDGLFAYQLAVVVDDHYQAVNRIVRGYDLLDSTPRQIYLQNALHYPRPVYAHIPVASNTLGQKLSKQHFAEPLEARRAREHVFQALRFLGQEPPAPLAHENVQQQLAWGIDNWDIQSVPKLANIPV